MTIFINYHHIFFLHHFSESPPCLYALKLNYEMNKQVKTKVAEE